jgi:hypothetical protein
MPLSTNAPEGASQGARPFASTEDAWHWTMAALVARRDGAGPILNIGRVARPCEPDDVVKCLDRLYRQRRIDLTHARILRIWGERQCAPDPHHPRERRDWKIWREAMERLDWPLRMRGIVAMPTPAHPIIVGTDGGGAAQAIAALVSEGVLLGVLSRNEARAILGRDPVAVTTTSMPACGSSGQLNAAQPPHRRGSTALRAVPRLPGAAGSVVEQDLPLAGMPKYHPRQPFGQPSSFARAAATADPNR